MAEAKQSHDYDTTLKVWFEVHKIASALQAFGGQDVKLDNPIDHHPFRKPKDSQSSEAAAEEVGRIKRHLARLQLAARDETQVKALLERGW